MLLPLVLCLSSNQDHHLEINLLLPSHRRGAVTMGFAFRLLIMGVHVQINGSPMIRINCAGVFAGCDSDTGCV